MPKKKQTKPTSKRSKKSEDAAPHADLRAIWKGYISFGLVNIPVILYPAEKPSQEVHFKLLDKRNLTPIKYVRINEDSGKEVPWQDIVKGYEYEDGNYAILTEDDFASIAQENEKTIEIEDFVDPKELGTVYFEKPYFLLADKRGDKGYVLLRETLKHTKKVGIARVMVRTHQYLAAIIPYGDALIVNTLRYPAEVKKNAEVELPKEPISHYKISKKEFEIAEQLVNTMAVKWDPDRYKNLYRQQLLKLIEEKVKSGGKKAIKHIEAHKVRKTNVVDFMELLKKSVKQKQPPSKSRKGK